MPSLLSSLFTLLLFSEICGTSVAVAGSYDDGGGRPDQESMMNAVVEDIDGVGSEMATAVAAAAGVISSPGGPLNRRGFTLDNRLGGGLPRIIIVSDTGFRGHRTHGPGAAFSRSRAALSDPNTDQTPGDLSVKIERRESDLDMLRCMIGRVYRPCWQA